MIFVPSTRRRLGRGFVWALAALLLGLLLPGIPVTSQTTDLPTTEAFRGIVQPVRQVTLNAPLEGVLAELRVNEGDSIAAGAPLLTMDDGVQKAMVQTGRLAADRQSDVEHARLVLAEAQIMLERIEAAFAASAANEWEVRKQRLQRDQAQAQLQSKLDDIDAAKARLRLEEERLARYTLTAPFAARVVTVQTERGATLTQRDPILTLADLSELEAVVHVAAPLYGRLTLGQAIELQADPPVTARLQARVKTLDPIIDPASQTFRCVLSIPNPEGRLPAGFTVTLRVP